MIKVSNTFLLVSFDLDKYTHLYLYKPLHAVPKYVKVIKIV